MAVFTGQLLARTCPSCRKPIPDGITECNFCAANTTAQNMTYPKIPGYKILTCLGQGGMGSVYLALELDLNRKVAIKILSPKLSQDTLAMERFEREARVMATVEHAHIVRVYTLSHFEGGSFLVLEYIEGESLADYIKRLKRLPISEALRIFRQIVEGLAASWSKKIVHRDVKPSNILLDRNLNAHVTDFGLAKPIDMQGLSDTISSVGILVGTPYYVAPEQALGQPVDFRADIYSLGIMLFEMLTGEKPFDGQTPFEIVNQHLTCDLPPIREKRSDISTRIVSLLEWLTQKKPGRRPKSYAELLEALESLQESRTAQHTSATSTISFLTSWHMRRTARAWMLPVILIAVAIFAFFFYQHKAPHIRAPGKPSTSLTIAIAPFYGPDEESAREGKIMGSLIEKTIRDRLGDEVYVIGVDQSGEPLRSHESARALGYKLQTGLVIWGDVVVVRNEIEIEPHLTMVSNKTQGKGIRSLPSSWNADPFASLTDQNPSAFVLKTEAANQIELRKTSAASIGDMVSILIAIQTLYGQKDPGKALSLFEQIPGTPENLYYRACALIQLQRVPEALETLLSCLKLDREYAPAHALLGDLSLTSGDLSKAIAHYKAATDSKQAFTTLRAFFQGDILYTKETFRTNIYGAGKELETSWLIGIDPARGSVIRRFHTPGIPQAFTTANGAVEVFYDPGFGQQRAALFEDGKLDLPTWGEEDLLLRIQSMQSGWVIPFNFLTAWQKVETLGNAKFEATEIADENAPQTLPDLEEALTVAIRNDPTQPWHRFFLGQALWWQGHKPEAEELWRQLTAANFSHVCYYEFSWMAAFFEGYGQKSWADFAYKQALELRKKLPLPVGYSKPAERMVNANFVRTAAFSTRNSGDLERAYLWLRRARELTGICPEADQFTALLWSNYFLNKGDLQRAASEKKLLLQAEKYPLNLTRATSLLDFSFYVFLGAVAAFLVVVLLLLLKAGRFYLSYNTTNNSAGAHKSSGKVVSLLLLLIGILAAQRILAIASIETFFTAACFFVFLAALFHAKRVTVYGFVGSIPHPQRRIFILSFFVLVATISHTIYHNSVVHALLSSPPVASDIQERPALLEYIEQRLSVSDTTNTRYVAAVLNHKMGNLQRAKDLYASIARHRGAQENLAALESGNAQSIKDVTPQELLNAISNVPWKSFVLSIWDPGKGLNIFSFELPTGIEEEGQVYLSSLLFQLCILFSVGLILLFLLISPITDGEVTYSTRKVNRAFGKTVSLLIPGAFDLERRRPLLGYLMLIAFLIAACAIVTQWMIPHRFPVPGVATFLQATNYFNLHPLPVSAQQLDIEAFQHHHFWSIFLAYPYAKWFWGFVVLAGSASFVLHLAKLPGIWRAV